MHIVDNVIAKQTVPTCPLVVAVVIIVVHHVTRGVSISYELHDPKTFSAPVFCHTDSLSAVKSSLAHLK